MNDILSFITMFLSKSWEFFKIDVPGTNFSFGVVLVGLALVGVGFRFLSIMLGHNIGEADPPTPWLSPNSPYGSRGLPSAYRLPEARKNDVR